MEASPSEFRNWALLPLLAVSLISQKVKSITDYSRFRAVCSSWRSGSDPKPRHLPPQLPWLMIPYYPEKSDDGMRLFYDCGESKVRKLCIPETINMICCASYGGWLLLGSTACTEAFLLNPLTRARIELPSFSTLKEQFEEYWYNVAPVDRFRYNPYTGNFAIKKMTFSTDLTDPNCLIMFFFKGYGGIVFCRVGDPGWTRVDVDSRWTSDVMYYNGRIYLLHRASVTSFESNKPEEVIDHLLERKLRFASRYFLQGKSGFYVVAIQSIEEEEEKTGLKYDDDIEAHKVKKASKETLKKRIELYQFEDQSMEFKKVAGTSNNTIFYGYDNCHYLAVCSDEWDPLEGGCMYMEYKCVFSTRKDGSESRCRISTTQVNKKAELPVPPPVVFSLGKVPLRWLNARPAMWFQPSFV